jgi:hypothetical protein
MSLPRALERLDGRVSDIAKASTNDDFVIACVRPACRYR